MYTDKTLLTFLILKLRKNVLLFALLLFLLHLMKPCHAKSVACIASVVQQPRNNFYKRRACSFKVMRILVALK